MGQLYQCQRLSARDRRCSPSSHSLRIRATKIRCFYEDLCYEDQVLLVQEAASVLPVRTEGLKSIVTVDSKQNGV